MLIRSLDRDADFALTRDLCQRAADYLTLEFGHHPDDAVVDEFFTESPPGIDPAASLHFGHFTDGTLAGIANMAFGYPDPQDAYIGLMLLATDCRGQGIGPRLLSHLQSVARAEGATRMLLAVLDANPRAHAFWQRMGFSDTPHRGTRQFGTRTHTLVRMARPL